jgi:hypothetical protein
MMKKIFIIALLSLIIIPLVKADNITMSVDQNTYYFLTGDPAIIPLTANNTYGKRIDGQLKYTITQEVNQGGIIYTNSNSQSTPFNIEEGNNTINLNFGSSDVPVKLDIDLLFSFNENGKREVALDDIIVFFVSNQSQMNNQKNPKESSSQEIKDALPSDQNNNQPQTPQQKLQNNQMSQDSQAIKEQMEKQIQNKEKQQQEFEQNLFNNSEFQEKHQELTEQGYEITEKNIQSIDNDTGEFEIEYQNGKGEEATLSGSMEDGEIVNLQKQTAEDRQQMLEQLNQSKKYQEFLNQLQKEGYNQTDINFDQNGNKTNLDLNYENEKNETATISAEFENNELKDVTLEKENQMNHLIWIIPLIIVILTLILYVIYSKYFKKNKRIEDIKTINKKQFDYKIEAKKLLLEAEKLFKQKKYKDAYGKAGQALRLYLSYQNGLKKEITNDYVIKHLKQKNRPYLEIKKCFDLCSLVEFAKYKENKKDFNEILKITSKTIAN